MAEVSLENETLPCLLSISKAAEFLECTAQEVRNRIDSKEIKGVRAPSAQRFGPRFVVVVDGRSLPWDAKERWLQGAARERMLGSRFFNQAPAALPASGEAAGCLQLGEHQGELFLSPLFERLRLTYEQKLTAQTRHKAILPLLNGDWRKRFTNKGECEADAAQQLGLSRKSVQRLRADYLKAGGGLLGLEALAKDRPGPRPSGPRGLDDSTKGKILELRPQGRSREQTYAGVCECLAGKQEAWRAGKTYVMPKRSAVYRYYASLGAPAKIAAEGRSALKAAEMQIHRSYTDCRALDRVDNDEWITDVFSFDPDNLLWRSGPKKGQVRAGRFYLLTMFDERSIYPLDALLVEFPGQEDEIDLLVRVCLDCGIPGLINSDRGRFRGKAFGGQFRQFDRERAREGQNGILDKLNIGRNMPREHNPQGSRLERFHRELARFSRTLPGWCGASTEERDELSSAAEQLRTHEDYCHGRAKTTPLLSREELLQRYQQFFAEWREHQSEGTDMNGLTPSIVFRRETPAEGFRRVTQQELDRITARVYENVLVQPGGHIDIPEGNYRKTRYYSHELVLIQGQRRTVERSRIDRSRIYVLPARPGDDEIVVPAVPRVGTGDPGLLSKAMAEKRFSRNLLRAATEPPACADLPAISSNAWMAAHLRPLVTPPSARERISPDEFIAGPPEAEEKSAPSLYEIEECTAEES